MNQQLSDYIKQARAAGMSDDRIRSELLNSGWADNDINSILDYPQTKSLTKKDLGTAGLIITSLVLSGVTYFLPFILIVVLLPAALILGVIALLRSIKERRVIKIIFSLICIILPFILFFGFSALLQYRENVQYQQLKQSLPPLNP